MSYTVATFTRLEQNADGSVKMIFTYTGDAGELAREFAYPFEATTPPSADYMRSLAMARLTTLNQTKNFITGALPFVNTVLDTTTPLPTAAASTFGSFVAASAPFTPGATPQDVFSITGSATRTVQVLRMGISTVQTTAGMNAWSLVKRSTANSAGTSATVTAVPSNKSFPGATATVRQYTANPTLGTVVGSIWSGRVAAPVITTAPGGDLEKCVLGNLGPSVTLSGITDVLAWNFGGVALPSGLSVQAWVQWAEN